MKYVVLVGDGMGDYPIPELDGKTILEASLTPNMDALAAAGSLGLAKTVPDRKEPGSDVANMSILGYDPAEYHTGRGPLEAASMGVKLAANELGFRLNLVTLEIQPNGPVIMRDHAGGHISSAEAKILVEALTEQLPLNQGQRIYPGVSYRHLLVWPGLKDGLPTVPPHDWRDREVTAYLNNPGLDMKPVLDLIKASWPILADHPVNRQRRAAGKNPANSIWPWGQGRPPSVSTYGQRWGVSGAVVSAVDLIKGLGFYAGLKAIEVPGATGLVDTNYEGKVQAALKVLETDDYVLVHIEAPDEAGHAGDMATKIKAVELFDQRIVGPMKTALEKMGDFRLMILCDHFTPISLKTHSRDPVPFILYPAKHPSGRPYTEAQAALAGIYLDKGDRLPELLFGNKE